jgi:hypothetical protein
MYRFVKNLWPTTFALLCCGLAGLCCGFAELTAHASGFDIGVGAITAHVNVGPGFHNYCNQIEKSDVIMNNVAFVRGETKSSTFTALVGEDSICSPIQGLFYGYKLYESKWFGMAFIFGGYHFDHDNWVNEENNVPAGKVGVSPVYTTIGKNFYIVPVGGIEIDIGLFHWDKDKWSLNVNTILTPIIIPTMISLKRSW